MEKTILTAGISHDDLEQIGFNQESDGTGHPYGMSLNIYYSNGNMAEVDAFWDFKFSGYDTDEFTVAIEDKDHLINFLSILKGNSYPITREQYYALPEVQQLYANVG